MVQHCSSRLAASSRRCIRCDWSRSQRANRGASGISRRSMQVSFRTDTSRLRAQTRFSRRRKTDPILEKLRGRLATWVCPMSRPTESALTLVYAVSLRALCLRLIPAITAHTRCYTRIRVVHAAVAGRRTGSTFSSRESTTEKIAVRACQGVSVGDWENETPRADHKLIVATTNRSYDVLAHCGPFGCRERPVPLLVRTRFMDLISR